jgi:hypothetical protein
MGKQPRPDLWQPPEHVVDDDQDIVMEWYEWFEAQLLQGRSFRTISIPLKISHVTLHRHVDRDPKLQEICNRVRKKWPEMLKAKAMELALDPKCNTTILIYLLKTIGGLGDGAQPTEPDESSPQPVPAMTKSEALKMVEHIRETQRRNNVSSTT